MIWEFIATLNKCTVIVLVSAVPWIPKSQEAEKTGLVYVETSAAGEIIIIVTSYFRWKKKPVRVEIYQKSFMDMLVF